jgi:hypothetical protein
LKETAKDKRKYLKAHPEKFENNLAASQNAKNYFPMGSPSKSGTPI